MPGVGSNEVLLGQKYIVSRTALGQGAFGAVVVGREAEAAPGDEPKKFAIKKIPIAVLVSNYPRAELLRNVLYPLWLPGQWRLCWLGYEWLVGSCGIQRRSCSGTSRQKSVCVCSPPCFHRAWIR